MVCSEKNKQATKHRLMVFWLVTLLYGKHNLVVLSYLDEQSNNVQLQFKYYKILSFNKKQTLVNRMNFFCIIKYHNIKLL